jgi:hypothetical protein
MVAGILRVATNAKSPAAFAAGLSQVKLVAGGRSVLNLRTTPLSVIAGIIDQNGFGQQLGTLFRAAA